VRLGVRLWFLFCATSRSVCLYCISVIVFEILRYECQLGSCESKKRIVPGDNLTDTDRPVFCRALLVYAQYRIVSNCCWNWNQFISIRACHANKLGTKRNYLQDIKPVLIGLYLSKQVVCDVG
jgi:hypothetical protein